MTALLQTIDLCCERDGRTLVDHLNLNAEAGNIYRIEGPNGSGKTTLLRVLSGLSSRYRGAVHWRGQAIDQQRAEYLSQLLYIGHSTGVKAALTARENLAWHASIRPADAGGGNTHSGRDMQHRIMAALQQVGLYGYEDMPCFALSAGQQRRVGLARLFLGQVALWILDEPFTAIDRHGVAELEGWIGQYSRQGGCVILTTHHQLTIDQPIHTIRLGEPL